MNNGEKEMNNIEIKVGGRAYKRAVLIKLAIAGVTIVALLILNWLGGNL